MLATDVAKSVVRAADVTDWKHPMLHDPKNIPQYINKFFGGGATLIRNDKIKEHFLAICDQLVLDAKDANSRKYAYMIIVNLYDQMIKDTICDAIDQRLAGVTAEEIRTKMSELTKLTTQFSTIKKQLGDAEVHIKQAQADIKSFAEDKNLHQYCATLEYAADKFGNPEERKVIKKLSSRIFLSEKGKAKKARVSKS